MKMPLRIMLVGVVVLLGVTGCSSSMWGPQNTTPDRSAVAEVTGFASIPVFNAPAGPVTVRITGAKASQLAVLVGQLPSVAQSQVVCAEGGVLMYRIVFAEGLVAPSKAVVEGYRCDAAVTVTVKGEASSWRRDANCTLIRVVRLLLPGRAKATRSLDIGCGS